MRWRWSACTRTLTGSAGCSRARQNRYESYERQPDHRGARFRIPGRGFGSGGAPGRARPLLQSRHGTLRRCRHGVRQGTPRPGEERLPRYEVLRYSRDGAAGRVPGGARRAPIPHGPRQRRGDAGRGGRPRGREPKLLAVTVLTSFDRQDIEDLGYPCEVSTLVDLRVRKARELGIDGIVASPLDAARIRRTAGREMIVVTPGVRSAGAAKGDQKRVATPAEAIRDGADYVVMGRQITRAADPAAELDRVLEEIAAV